MTKTTREMFALSTLPNTLDEANARAFERACAADGIDPSGGVSPSLLRKLGGLENARAAAEAGYLPMSVYLRARSEDAA